MLGRTFIFRFPFRSFSFTYRWIIFLAGCVQISIIFCGIFLKIVHRRFSERKKMICQFLLSEKWKYLKQNCGRYHFRSQWNHWCVAGGKSSSWNLSVHFAVKSVDVLEITIRVTARATVNSFYVVAYESLRTRAIFEIHVSRRRRGTLLRSI